MTINPEGRLYQRVAPLLALLALVVAVGAGMATYLNDRADAQRDRAITKVNSQSIDRQEQLLVCFNRFATALAGGLPPVREASANWNAAVAGVVSTLTSALVLSQSGQAGDPEVQAVIDAGNAFVEANAALTEAREENPYPEAPEQFCDALEHPE